MDNIKNTAGGKMNNFKINRRTLLIGGAFGMAAMATSGIWPSNLVAGENNGDISTTPQKTPVIGSRKITDGKYTGSCAKVYFSPQINAESLIRLYNMVNDGIYGRVAIKLHTGEPHGPNILPRDMVKALQETIPQSNIVETNVLYEGGRHTTEEHRKTLQINGWTFCPVDILDEHGDANFPVEGGFHLKEVAVGKGLEDYDSMLVLTHFKGHPSGGYGGSMKNIAIGCASGKVGKRQVHGVNMTGKPDFSNAAKEDRFMELMADSARAVADHFGKHITYINVLRNISVDCDCVGVKAAKPVMKNIGILASTDLLAIDQASCDLIFGSNPEESHDMIERIMSRHGLRQLSAMREHKMGNPQYQLINIG